MKLAYYPGCTLKGRARNFEETLVVSSSALGVELEELPKWSCCGTVCSLASDDLMRQLAPIRNLIRTQEMGSDGLVAPCAMCYNTMKRANLLVKGDREKLETVNEFMDREVDYDGTVEVLHPLQVFGSIGMHPVRKKASRPLTGLKISPYYGCLLIRPSAVAIDDPRNPRVMELLLEALGAEVVDSPLKAFCCGAYLTINRKDAVANMAHKIIAAATTRGADVMTTSCPLCFFNLDSRQEEVQARYPGATRIPILYFTQLVALALDLGDSCDFTDHYMDPRPLLEERELL